MVHLQVGRSRHRSVLLGLFAAAGVLSQLALAQRGYGLLSLALFPLWALLLAVGLRQPDILELHHQRGAWTLIKDGEARTILPLPGNVCLPWLVYFRFCEPGSGRRQTLWLFPDSAAPESLATLRRCLTLLE